MTQSRATRTIIRRVWWGIAFLVIAVCGCAYTLVRNGAVNESEADKVEAGLPKLRELNFTSKVPLVVKTRDEAQQMLRGEMARDHSDEDLRIGGETGAMTGLFPPGIALKYQTLKLLRGQIAGFYEPHQKEMVLVEGGIDLGFWNHAAQLVTQRDIVGEMILAHELTHALQDQHFHIESMLDRVKDNDDRTLALKAVAEGDATLAGFGYVTGGLSQSRIDLIVSHLADLPQTFAAQSGDVPEGLSVPLMFQYSSGTRFVGEAYRRGGWAAVNALYKNPPQSTQQIMQLPLYYDRPTPPAQINLKGYGNILKGWSEADHDTYGEMLLELIMKRNLPNNASALTMLSQWAGDNMVVLKKGAALTIVWIVAFRDDDTARKFADAYTSILDNLRGEANPHRVEAKSAAVLVVIGAGAEQFATLAPAIWKATTIQPGEPPSQHSSVGSSNSVSPGKPAFKSSPQLPLR
jgi:hypothetical protein